MKLPHYGYHASDNTLRLDRVPIARLTTPEGRVLSIPDAKRITDALNDHAALLDQMRVSAIDLSRTAKSDMLDPRRVCEEVAAILRRTIRKAKRVK